MWVRAKVVKGVTYHQVVDTVRVGSKVRQRVVVSLGTTADPAEALAAARRELAEIDRERSRHSEEGSEDTWAFVGCDDRLDGLLHRRSKLVGRERILAAVVERGLIGAPRRPSESAKVRALHAAAKAVAAFRAGWYVRLVTIAPSKVDRLAPDGTMRDRLRSCRKDPEVWCQVEALADRLLIDDTISGRQAKGVCSRARRAYRAAHSPASGRRRRSEGPKGLGRTRPALTDGGGGG